MGLTKFNSSVPNHLGKLFNSLFVANEITFEANVIDTSNKDIVVASGNVKILKNWNDTIKKPEKMQNLQTQSAEYIHNGAF